MPLIEPRIKRVISLIDGQNLYRSAKECFGYHFPNFDALALSHAVCNLRDGWHLDQARFYTGVPSVTESALWHHFWQAKLLAMKREGVYTFSRATRNGKEKGIDVQIAIDAIGLAHKNLYDVALIFSQDQDLSGIVQEIKKIAAEQGRWIRVACAFPCSPPITKRGINNTDWIEIEKRLYDGCIDARDHRRMVVSRAKS
jgi:uncharacterized LabA/DUF88 family protein